MYSGEAVEKAELAAQLLGILVVAPVPAESRDYFGSKILASARHTWSGVRKFPILVWAVTNSGGCSKKVLSNLDWLGEFSKIPTWPDPRLGHPGLVPSGDWVHLEKDFACISILCLFFPPSNTDIRYQDDWRCKKRSPSIRTFQGNSSLPVGSPIWLETVNGLAVCYGLAEDRIWANDSDLTFWLKPGIMEPGLGGIIPIAGRKSCVSETWSFAQIEWVFNQQEWLFNQQEYDNMNGSKEVRA